MKPNWTEIIIVAFVVIVAYLAPSPIHWGGASKPPTVDSASHTVTTIHDTMWLPAKPFQGHSESTVHANRDIQADTYYEQVTIDSTKDYVVNFRSRTYPILDHDSLKAYIVHDWNVTPRAIQIVVPHTTTVDTIYMTKVEVPEVPFIEKPAVVAIATAVVVGLLAKFLLN